MLCAALSALTGSGVVLTTSGSGTTSLQPNNAVKSNKFTGNATISSGAIIDLIAETNISVSGTGRVWGTLNAVTVQSGGQIRTKKGTVQCGKARYNNLTMQGGAVLKLGYASKIIDFVR